MQQMDLNLSHARMNLKKKKRKVFLNQSLKLFRLSGNFI